ncbi:MAG: cytochrome c oxidase subunit 3 [Buchnera aphidicola (Nurudea shiraii)]
MNNVINVKENMAKLTTKVLNSSEAFGFWLYLMSDCIMFSTLFSVYFVMRSSIFFDFYKKEIFNLSIVVLESFVLLLSSFSYSFIILKIKEYKKNEVVFWFIVTILLGLFFLILETSECYFLIKNDCGPSHNGFLSAFFTLLLTHGFHVLVAILWACVLIVQVIKFGITYKIYSRIFFLSLFWHFLDIIWVFIFSTVHLVGAIL